MNNLNIDLIYMLVVLLFVNCYLYVICEAPYPVSCIGMLL